MDWMIWVFLGLALLANVGEGIHNHRAKKNFTATPVIQSTETYKTIYQGP